MFIPLLFYFNFASSQVASNRFNDRRQSNQKEHLLRRLLSHIIEVITDASTFAISFSKMTQSINSILILFPLRYF